MGTTMGTALKEKRFYMSAAYSQKIYNQDGRKTQHLVKIVVEFV